MNDKKWNLSQAWEKPLPGSAETPPVPVDDNPFLPFLCVCNYGPDGYSPAAFLINIEKNGPVPGQF